MRFVVQFKQTDQRLAVQLRGDKRGFDTAFKGIQRVTAKPDVEYYTGDYYITPKVDAQKVPTAHKYLSDDLTVKAIPTYNVGNTSGGSTFYIATMEE